jgi:hypothetical protein
MADVQVVEGAAHRHSAELRSEPLGLFELEGGADGGVSAEVGDERIDPFELKLEVLVRGKLEDDLTNVQLLFELLDGDDFRSVEINNHLLL